MFYEANLKSDGMKNYAVSHSDKENILFEAMQEEPYANNATQYLFVDPTFLDLINDDYNRYYEQEIYYDCQSNYAEDEAMYCQNFYKRQSLRMSEVLNEIVRPKEFKKVLKQLSLNSNTLYRSFRQAYRRAKKTRKSSTKTTELKCKCLKCGGAKNYDEFLIQMNQGDMNPWDINSVELPPYQQTWNIGDGIEAGKNKNIDVKNDIETYCMWLNQKHSKCCRSWESHSMKSRNFPPTNNQTIDNWLHQTPSGSKEIYVCNKTDILPKEMPHSKSMEQAPVDINQGVVNDMSPQYVTYSCTPVASTKTVNEPNDDEIPKVMPICLMIPLNIKIDSQEGQLHSSGVEFMMETSKAKQNQIFVGHENTMECTILPAKPRTLQESIDDKFDAFAGTIDVQQTKVAKKIEFAPEIQPCNINPQPQQTIQIEQQALKPKPMYTKSIDLMTNVKSSEIKVDSTHMAKDIQKQPTKDNQSCHLNETAKLPPLVDATTEQLPSTSKSNIKSIEMKTDSRQQSPKGKQSCTCIKIAIPSVSITTTDHQNDLHTNAQKIQELQSPKTLQNTLGPESVQENKSIKSCPCTKIVNFPVSLTTTHLQKDLHKNEILQPGKTLNKSEKTTDSLQSKPVDEIKSTRSCPCIKIANEKIQELQSPKILNQSENITENLRPDTVQENKSMTVQSQALHEPARMPEDRMKLVHKPLPTIYETMPLAISESQQFDRHYFDLAFATGRQSVTEIVQTNISTVQHYKRKTMSMELQPASDSKEIPPKATETSKESVTESVQTDISSVQHYKRKQMRTEIQHDLEELLQPNPSTSKQIYDSDERDEILLDLHRLFHPEKASILPEDLSRQKALRDLNYIVKPESPTGITPINSKLPESQDSILASIRHMISSQPGPQEKTKRRKYNKQTKEKILEDLQIFLKPVKAKPTADKTLRNSVLSDLRFMLVTGEDKTSPKRPNRSFSSYQRPSTSSNSSVMGQRPTRPPEVIRECIITDCRYLPNSTSHLEKETVDDLETAAQFYQRQLGFDNHSAIFFQGPL